MADTLRDRIAEALSSANRPNLGGAARETETASWAWAGEALAPWFLAALTSEATVEAVARLDLESDENYGGGWADLSERSRESYRDEATTWLFRAARAMGGE